MSKGGRSARQRADAASELQRAGALLEAGRFSEALPVLREAGEVLQLASIDAAVGDCLHALGRTAEALDAYRQGLARHHADADLALRLASRSLEQGRFVEALPAFRIALGAHRHDATFLRSFAYAALQAEGWAEAETQARAAVELSPDDDSSLLLGLALAAQSRFGEAAAALESSGSGPARALGARMHALGGNLQRALELFAEAESRGGMGAGDWATAAQVAALSGERAQAERYLARARESHAGAETQLAAAQLALLQGEPERALHELGALSTEDPLERALATALAARAHRLAGRDAEAAAALDRLVGDVAPRVRAMALVDRGHLHAEAGEFDAAERAFAEALAIDASDPEAQRGLERARQKLSWKRDVLADADKKVDAARAEAEAVRRAVMDREGELARLKKQLAELERERREAEDKARQAQVEAQAAHERAESERRAALQRELEAREAEARAKVESNIGEAFGGRVAEVPPPLLEALRVAELTYQKALQTDLPGAGVAVLYSGVLERALYVCLVAELDRHLDASGTRAALLEDSRRMDGRGKPEYLDHFVGAFDRERPMRAPGLGEVARVLRRRGEPHLAVVRAFLEAHRGYPPAFLDALAAFVDQSKERLRDPIAHGRVLEIADREVAEFRRALLAEFEGGRGVLFRLVFPRG